MGICGPTHDARSWTFDLDPGGRDPVLGIERLQEAFFARDPDYPLRNHRAGHRRRSPAGRWSLTTSPRSRSTCPPSGLAFHRDGAPDLYPERLRERDRRHQRRGHFADVNNGVYQCRIRRSPGPLRAGVRPSVRPPGRLSERLTDQRYLVGDTITEADIRLFTTLARFDAVYHGHFKCNRNKLTEMPVLWAYARDLFQTPGFGDTIDFDQIKEHYYVVHRDLNPSGIVPRGPDRVAGRRRIIGRSSAVDRSVTAPRRVRWQRGKR